MTQEKISRSEYMAALQTASEEIDDGNPMSAPQDGDDDGDGPVMSEAERLACDADAPRIRSIRQRPLTSKQLAFVRAIVEGKSQRAAYRSAYPDDRSADHSVSAAAAKLMKHPVISQMLEEAWSETVELLADDAAATKRYVMRQLLAMSKTAKQEGSRLKALEMMARSAGLFREQVIDTSPAPSAAQLKRELAGHLKLINGKV
jgi:hypothetical protein